MGWMILICFFAVLVTWVQMLQFKRFILSFYVGVIASVLFIVVMFSAWQIGLFGIFLTLPAILLDLYLSRCPVCKKVLSWHWGEKELVHQGEIYFTNQTSDGKRKRVRDNVYIYHWCCKHCDHTLDKQKTEKETVS